MSSANLIGGLEYFRLSTYENLMVGLAKIITINNLDGFQAFEIELARVKKERDSFSDKERRAISETLIDEGYPPRVLSGVYLDELEKIVVIANLIIREGVSDKGERVVYVSGRNINRVTTVCLNGLRDFPDYIAEGILMKDHVKSVKGVKPLARNFLRYTEAVYMEALDES